MPHTLIFDIGKTNKKCFIFDENFQEVYRDSVHIEEIRDEDGDPCDDLQAIEKWIKNRLKIFLTNQKFNIKTVNFSTYGASLVHVDKNGKPLAPLYNYLKPYPEEILNLFYEKYGNKETIAKETASPALAMLNSGLQLFWLKHAKPDVFKNARRSIHFSQYLSFLFTGKAVSDYTSLGCHTSLWDFKKKDYHAWVKKEGFVEKLPPLVSTSSSIMKKYNGQKLKFGTGIHDSSAALLPYILVEQDPFVLISTGTWSITLNPFNDELLTTEELEKDCLNYMQIDGKPVKAARLFLGKEYQLQIEKLNRFFQKSADYYTKIKFDERLFLQLKKDEKSKFHFESIHLKRDQPQHTNLENLKDYEKAYHQLMLELVALQIQSTKLAIGNTTIKKVYIDGGFTKNVIFIKLLSRYFPNLKIRTVKKPMGSALGAALVLNEKKLNRKLLKKNLGLK